MVRVAMPFFTKGKAYFQGCGRAVQDSFGGVSSGSPDFSWVKLMAPGASIIAAYWADDYKDCFKYYSPTLAQLG